MAKKPTTSGDLSKKDIKALPWNTQEYRDAKYALTQPISEHRVSAAQQQAASRTVADAEAARIRRIVATDPAAGSSGPEYSPYIERLRRKNPTESFTVKEGGEWIKVKPLDPAGAREKRQAQRDRETATPTTPVPVPVPVTPVPVVNRPPPVVAPVVQAPVVNPAIPTTYARDPVSPAYPAPQQPQFVPAGNGPNAYQKVAAGFVAPPKAANPFQPIKSKGSNKQVLAGLGTPADFGQQDGYSKNKNRNGLL